MIPGHNRSPVRLSACDPASISQAADAVRGGAVIAIPTDTVYGLAAALDQPSALARLFRLKNRPLEKAIPVLLSEIAVVQRVAGSVPACASMLMDRFWPGALTIVVPADSDLPAEATSEGNDHLRTVALRVPDHVVARAILAAAGGALAVTSANRSGMPPALDPQQVVSLGEAAPDLVLDGGPAVLQNPSTIVSAIGDEVMVLREGAISLSELVAATPCFVRLSDAIVRAV